MNLLPVRLASLLGIRPKAKAQPPKAAPPATAKAAQKAARTAAPPPPARPAVDVQAAVRSALAAERERVRAILLAGHDNGQHALATFMALNEHSAAAEAVETIRLCGDEAWQRRARARWAPQPQQAAAAPAPTATAAEVAEQVLATAYRIPRSEHTVPQRPHRIVHVVPNSNAHHHEDHRQ